MNGEQPPKKKRTWLWVVVGVFVFFVIVAAGGLFFAVSFFRQAMTVTDMSHSSAESEFETVRAKFAGQQPLIRVVDGKPQYVGEPTTEASSTRQLTTMHIMAWDDEEEKLVRLAIPFWLLRLKSGPIQLSAYSQGWDDRGVSFRVEDLERHGPGLLLDESERDEGRVIIWTE